MTCDQCEYIAGACIHCGQKQPVFNGKKEAVLSSINFGSKIAPTPQILKKKRITSEFQMVVDEVMTYLHEDIYKKGNFARYAGIIKRVGINQSRIWIKEMKGRGITNSRYFMKMYGNHKLKK